MLLLILLRNFAERLALIRQQRADAAKKREEEKAGTFLYTCTSHLRFSSYLLEFYVFKCLCAAKEQKKAEARK